MRLLLALLLCLAATPAAAQCFSQGHRTSFVYPSQVYHAPVVVKHAVPHVAPVVLVKDHSYPAAFQVTYNVAFPPAAVTGSTVYGYSAPANYSFLDPAGWLSAASRYNETAQLSASKGFTEFNESAKFVFGQQHTVLEQQSRIALLAEVSKLLSATQPGQTSAVQLRATRDTTGGVKIDSLPLPPGSSVAEIFKAECVSCHNPTKLDGKLDLTDLAKLDSSYEDKILLRLTTPDAKLRMPPGKPLSHEKLRAILNAMTAKP